MYSHPRSRSIVLAVLFWALLGSSTALLADEGDARLKKRIAELETENRALRKIIGELQGVLKTVPESTTLVSKKANGLRIIIFPDGWGDSGLADIRKVCESAGGAIASQLSDDGFAPILVQRNRTGPITLYRRGKGNEHIVQLSTGDRAWAQFAYQFSHEFCHIVCNYREAKNTQLWFEESMCECASLYSLRRMAIEWKTNPPYSNWKSYSTSLASYANERMKKYEGREESVAKFYQANQAGLEKTGTNRDLNGFIAVKLLPLLEATPEAWQALRYINLGPPEENVSFKAYLTGWHDRVPKKHRPFVRQVAAQFEFELAETE